MTVEEGRLGGAGTGTAPSSQPREGCLKLTAERRSQGHFGRPEFAASKIEEEHRTGREPQTIARKMGCFELTNQDTLNLNRSFCGFGTVATLSRYHSSRSIRELQNFIDRAIILSPTMCSGLGSLS